MMIAHFCVKKTFLSHLYENVANHDFDRFRPRKLFVKISSICYQKRKWNIKHKRFIEQSISYHIGWSTLRSKGFKNSIFLYYYEHIHLIFFFTLMISKITIWTNMQFFTAELIRDRSILSSIKPQQCKYLFVDFCVFTRSYLNLSVLILKLFCFDGQNNFK